MAGIDNLAEVMGVDNDLDPIKRDGLLIRAAQELREYKEVLSWLRDAADTDCRNCDGSGIFYGNVHLCGCVTSKT